MYEGGLVTDDREGLLNFQQQVGNLYRAVSGTQAVAGEIQNRIDHLIEAVRQTPAATEDQARALRALKLRMQDIDLALNGDSTISSRNEPVPMSIATRVNTIASGIWDSQSGVTGNFRDSYEIADRMFGEVLADIRSVVSELESLESQLENKGAPWTPGRIPDWK